MYRPRASYAGSRVYPCAVVAVDNGARFYHSLQIAEAGGSIGVFCSVDAAFDI